MKKANHNAANLVDTILIDAHINRASDIHIEPSASLGTTCIRFRINGECQDYMEVQDAMASGLFFKIKMMANLDVSETTLPQDGYFKFCRKHIPAFGLRVTTFPTHDSEEDVVLKIMTDQ